MAPSCGSEFWQRHEAWWCGKVIGIKKVLKQQEKNTLPQPPVLLSLRTLRSSETTRSQAQAGGWGRCHFAVSGWCRTGYRRKRIQFFYLLLSKLPGTKWDLLKNPSSSMIARRYPGFVSPLQTVRMWLDAFVAGDAKSVSNSQECDEVLNAYNARIGTQSGPWA